MTLAGTPAVSVYKGSSTTESTAGVTLTVDHDGRTGRHHVKVDTSADGTFYAAANDFQVVITTGTVSSISVVGVRVASFSIENRTQKADVRKWNGAAVAAPNTTGVPKVDAVLWLGSAPNVLIAGRLDANAQVLANGSIAAATFAAGAVDATAFAQGAADKVWSTAARTITGGTIGSIAGVTFPANFSVLSITPVTGRMDLGKWLGDVPGIVDTGDGTIPVHLVACQDSAIANNAFAPNAIDAGAFAQGAADKVWLTTARTITGGTITTYTGDTPQTGDAFARLGAPAGANVSADVAAVKADTGNLVTRIPAALFAGITSLAQWLGLLAGKQVGNATARTEIRATGAGAGTFDETTDSEQAIRDRGDAAWTTGAGGGGGTVNDEETIVESDETINVS